MSDTIALAIPGEHIHIAVDEITRPFFEAGREGKLAIQQCAACGTFRFPPRPFCNVCQSEETEWPVLSGRGSIYTFAVAHRSPFRGVVPDFTYIPVIVALDEAPHCRVLANLVDVDPDDVAIGQSVDFFWNDIADGWKVPLCRIAG